MMHKQPLSHMVTPQTQIRQDSMRCIHLARLLFKDGHEYAAQVANNVKEGCVLIEQGRKYTKGEYADDGKISARRKNPMSSKQQNITHQDPAKFST